MTQFLGRWQQSYLGVAGYRLQKDYRWSAYRPQNGIERLSHRGYHNGLRESCPARPRWRVYRLGLACRPVYGQGSGNAQVNVSNELVADSSAWTGFRDWGASAAGRRFLLAERDVYDRVLPKLYGYQLVQVGEPGVEGLMRAATTLRRCIVDPVGNTQPGEWCQALPEQLPIASDCIDVVAMPHILEFCADPHQALREADRILVPEGQLLLSAFNPISLWGMRRLVQRRAPAPWNGHLLGHRRCGDWLRLLGFEIRQLHYYFPIGASLRLPSVTEAGGGPLERCLATLSGGYLLVARKKVSTLTPIRPRWIPRRSLVSARVMEPVTRSIRVREGS